MSEPEERLFEALCVHRGDAGSLSREEAMDLIWHGCARFVQLSGIEADALARDEAADRMRDVLLYRKSGQFRGHTPKEAIAFLHVVAARKLLDVLACGAHRLRSREPTSSDERPRDGSDAGAHHESARRWFASSQGSEPVLAPERILHRLLRRLQLLRPRTFESIELFIQRRIAPYGQGPGTSAEGQPLAANERARVDKQCERGGERLLALADELDAQLEEAEQWLVDHLVSELREKNRLSGEE